MKRWGHDSLWLHVDSKNEAARKLYESCGYAFVRKELFTWPEERLLLKKEIKPVHRVPAVSAAGFDPPPRITGGHTRVTDGVFVWEAARE